MFGLVEKPVNQVPSTERTRIYSKVVVSFGSHAFLKPVKNPVLYCPISLRICARHLDVATHHLNVIKGI